MTTRYAEPVSIPRLKQKLGALYLLSTGIDGDNALGRLFASDDDPKGITGKAIRNWIYGEGTRYPDHVPAERYGRLVEIFRARIPERRTEAEIRSILQAKTERDVVLAFLSGAPPIDWLTLVLAAETSQAKVIIAERAGVLGVTSRRRAIENIEGTVSVPVKEPFRLELGAGYGWLHIVQWGLSGWFGLEVNDDTVAIPLGPNPSLVPRVRPYFDENEPGNRRYLFIQTHEPLPPDAVALLEHSARSLAPLDATALVRLTHVVDAQKATITALDVTFVET